MQIRKPNFFIVGAPRCGTSALYSYLRNHPLIFMSELKEPHYFAPDLGAFRHVTSLDAYLKLFSDQTPRHVAVGEASPFYLYSQVAPQRLYDFNPEAKLIAMLRNPADLAYSFHSLAVWHRWEDQDFESAWRLQTNREQGIDLPSVNPYPFRVQYRKIATLGEQVERLLRVFPRDQVQFILYEDFAQSTAAVYADTLKFLGVPHDGSVHFRRINQGCKTYRFKYVGRVYQAWDPVVGHHVKKLIGMKATGIISQFLQLNITRPDPLATEARQEVTEVFREDVRNLARLIGKDLTHWQNEASSVTASG